MIEEASLEYSYTIFSCFTMTVMSCVFATLILFPTIRKQNFVGFTLPACGAWFLASLAWSFGFPPDGSILCNIQAPVWIYFSFATVIWFALVAYHFFSNWVLNKPFTATLGAHFVSWTFPCFAAFAPLASVPYGRSEFLGNLGPCAFRTSDDYFFLTWLGATFLGIFVLSGTAGMALLLIIYCKFHKVGGMVAFFLAVPLIGMLLWLPFGVMVVVIFVNPSSYQNEVVFWLFLLGCQIGNVLAIAFFISSSQIRTLWWRFLVKRELEMGPNFDPSGGSSSSSVLRSSLVSMNALSVTSTVDSEADPYRSSY